ncbi:MAG: TrkH family potassium uptake protein [Eubacterium sp.]
MNKSMIAYILGWIMKLEGLFMLIPVLVALIYREHNGVWFAIVAVCALVFGAVVTHKKPESNVFYMREGCIATAMSWFIMSVIGCLPFFLSGEIPSFTDALFETVSGFTTTGSTILSDVESLSYCMLFWRSFTHWIGGMGVLVFLLAVIQMTGGSNMNLLRAESPGPAVGKLVPRMMHTARILYAIYLGMTVILFVLLVCGKMSVFESLTTAFSTAGTGGFGIRNDSLASCSPYIQWIVTIFMILFGVNFNAFYFLLLRKWKQLFHMEEVWAYFGVIVAAILIIMTNTYGWVGNVMENLRNTSFQVGSIITTTGFMTVDFDQWPSLSRYVMLFLMMIGACAGSTGGGMKVSRFLLSVKSALRELNSYLFPKSIKKIKMDGKTVDEEAIRGINVYFTAYMLLVILSTFLVCIDGTDLVSGFSSVLGTFNNIGPGLAKYGPACNFGVASTFSKCVYIFDMLAGRLEIFPVLILLYPPSWRGTFEAPDQTEKNSRTNISVS